MDDGSGRRLAWVVSRRRRASPTVQRTPQGSEVCRWCNLPACDHPLYEIVPGGCLRLIPIEEEGFGGGDGEGEDDEEGGDDPSRDRVFIDVVRVNLLRRDNFNWHDISSILSINIRTLRRWRHRGLTMR